MLRTYAIILVAALALSACSTGRWAGFNNCSADGSTVWWEFPNSKGSYDGLNNGPCKK